MQPARLTPAAALAAACAGAAAWCSLGTLALSDASSRAVRVGLLPPLWWLAALVAGSIALAWALRLSSDRARPLFFSAVIFLPWLPVRLPPALLLWAGGAMAFVGGMPQLGWAIWGVVVINAVFSFWQEFRAERATEALRRILPRTARVVRDGCAAKLPAEDLVPGDVILLAEGDSISADARLVEASELRVNLSTLTGESVPAPRTSEASEREDLPATERPNLVFAGTAVASGTGRAVVFATGMGTAFGTIALLTQRPSRTAVSTSGSRLCA